MTELILHSEEKFSDKEINDLEKSIRSILSEYGIRPQSIDIYPIISDNKDTDPLENVVLPLGVDKDRMLHFIAFYKRFFKVDIDESLEDEIVNRLVNKINKLKKINRAAPNYEYTPIVPRSYNPLQTLSGPDPLELCMDFSNPGYPSGSDPSQIKIGVLDDQFNSIARNLQQNYFDDFPITGAGGYNCDCHVSQSSPAPSGGIVLGSTNLYSTCTGGAVLSRNIHGLNIVSILSNRSGSYSVTGAAQNISIVYGVVASTYAASTTAAIIFAFYYAFLRGAKILNLSQNLKSEIGSYDANLDAAIQTLNNDGGISIWAAGNDNENVKNIFPQNQNHVITVAGVDKNRKVWPDSNFGCKVDLCALSNDVPMIGVDNNPVPPKLYSYSGSGTSFATPFVAAAAARILLIDSTLTFSGVKQKLKNSCTTIQGIGFWRRRKYGAGVLNFANIN